MKHNLWYDKESKILFLKFTSDYLKTDVPEIMDKIVELLDGKPYRQMVILISKTYKVKDYEAFELSSKILSETQITDAAFVGGSAANRMVAKIILKTGNLKTKGNFFKTKEDAINWIKSRR